MEGVDAGGVGRGAGSAVDCKDCGTEGFFVWHSATCLCNLLLDGNLAVQRRQEKASSLAFCMANCRCLSAFSIANSLCCFCIPSISVCSLDVMYDSDADVKFARAGELRDSM